MKKTPFYFSFINLGCTKNLVDTQFLMGKLFSLGANNPNFDVEYFIDPYDKAVDIVFLNSCGFISSGRDEMWHTIEKLVAAGKKVYALGCAVQYYKTIHKQATLKDFGKNLNFLSWNEFDMITLQNLINGYESKKFDGFTFSESPRAYTNIDQGFEYVKIAEGCDNHCSFCIIPNIRGKQRSLSMEAILAQVTDLVDAGAKEIILIAQDSTRYGTDLYGKPMLFELLEKIDTLPGEFGYRVLYLYPDTITLAHLEKLTHLMKFIPYFDIPLQHSSSPILKRMGRFYNEEAVETFLNFIKENFPTRFVRTNIIIGFPGETKEDFEHLKKFIKRHDFDNIALFEYHDEPFAASSKLDKKVDEKVIRERFLELDDIVDQKLTNKEQERKGKEFFGFITDIREKKKGEYHFTVRPSLHAPEIDAYDHISFTQILDNLDGEQEIGIGSQILYIL